jgi:hypothetical protein
MVRRALNEMSKTVHSIPTLHYENYVIKYGPWEEKHNPEPDKEQKVWIYTMIMNYFHSATVINDMKCGKILVKINYGKNSLSTYNSIYTVDLPDNAPQYYTIVAHPKTDIKSKMKSLIITLYELPYFI